MKLHIGCGKVILPGWTNLDIEAGPGVDIVDDARTLESIERESCDIIYASHILDHFGRHEIANVLERWHSRLKPGGTLRLAVSDFSQVVAEYTNKHELGALLGHIVGGHKSPFDRHGIVFDRDLLEKMLTAAGFVGIERWDWRKMDHGKYDDFSQAYTPHMNKTNGRHMSLNLQARRPAVAAHMPVSAPAAAAAVSAVGRDFYLKQIKQYGLSPAGSVPDEYIREREEEAILDALGGLVRNGSLVAQPRILEVGCGSGLLLDALHAVGYARVNAFDAIQEFVDLARSRKLPYDIWLDDVRHISGGGLTGSGHFDVVISQRVVINVLDQDEQRQAFHELRRMVKPGGYLIMTEGFADAWRNLNDARLEFDLPAHPMAKHNRWLEREEFDVYTYGLERVRGAHGHAFAPSNFLSSYFYATRVLHDVLRIGAGISEEAKVWRGGPFARFMGEVLPPVGDYANIQFYMFRKPKE